MSKEQTALERIKNEVAKEKGYDNWRHMEINWPTVVTDNIWPEVCERYARECCQATQRKIAENVRLETNWEKRVNGKVVEKWEPILSQFARLQSNAQVRVHEASITNKDNIVIL